MKRRRDSGQGSCLASFDNASSSAVILDRLILYLLTDLSTAPELNSFTENAETPSRQSDRYLSARLWPT